MATYKNAAYLTHSASPAFDNDHNPGVSTPFSGIYRCTGCGREVSSEHANPLPPQSHHQHIANQGNIRWRLIAYADHQPK